MGWAAIISISIFLVVVFAILGILHRHVQKMEEQQLLRQIEEARESGSNQALTQHPHIDTTRCIGCGSCAKACPEAGALGVVNGKACLIHASRCVGHGYCQAACPMGALTVGLGDLSNRSDIPLLTEEGETTVPNLFIAGELGGIGLIKHAITQGSRVVDLIAKRAKKTPASNQLLDLLIVGCGPAGISASLRAKELGLSFLVIDQADVGGGVRRFPRNKMTLTQPVHLPGFGKMKRSQYRKEELIELWCQALEKHEIIIKAGVKLETIVRQEDGALCAETSIGTLCSTYCILALGRRGTPRRLNVPGEDAAHVLYQLTDAAMYTNQQILIVGGGDSAIEAALALVAQTGNKVTISYRKNAFFRLKQRNREQLDAAIAEQKVDVLYNSSVHQIGKGVVAIGCKGNTASEVRKLPADYVFIFAGGEPPYPLLKKMGIAFNGEQAEKPAS